MDAKKHYYRILQVSEDADSSVIAAAYRALAKRYHPDVAGAAGAARMQEINEAYKILSDAASRANYDRARDRSEDLRDEPSQTEEDEDERRAWALKCELYPEIKEEFDFLRGVSLALANTFRLSLTGPRELEQHAKISAALRGAFLARYFGNSSLLQQEGERLIRAGDKKKAKELNDIIATIGKDLSFDQVQRILNKIKTQAKVHAYNDKYENVKTALAILVSFIILIGSVIFVARG